MPARLAGPSLVLALFLLGPGLVMAQEEAPPPATEEAALRETFARVRVAALRERRTYRLLADLCRQAPRRLSGSPAAAAAVEWARQAMHRAGLERVRLEPCTVPRWVRGEPELLRVVAPPELLGEELPLLALGGSVATPPEGLTAAVIAVRSFEELAARAEEARGKIVLFDRPMDPTEPNAFAAYGAAVGQRTGGAADAAKLGGVAALVRSMTNVVDDTPHTGTQRYDDDVPRVPAAAISTRAAERLRALLDAGREVRLTLRMSCRTLEDVPSANVVGELRGRERPEEVVLVGAHLDAWDVGQGAHDDGAGCCQVLEAVRLLKDLGLRPRRTLRVVLYMNEENGLRGARAYAEAHREELARHVLAIESDRGGFTPRGFTTDANPEARAVLAGIAAHLADIGAERVLPGGGGADISVLAKAGVPLVGYLPDSQRYFELHHTERDVLEAVSERELELGTVAIACLAWAVAEREQALPRNEPK